MRKLWVGVGVAVIALIVAWLVWGREDDRAQHAIGARSGSGSSVRVGRGSDSTTALPAWVTRGFAGKPIAGIVVGEDGAPIAGATVRLSNMYMLAGFMPHAAKQTDASGRFDFGALPAASYSVTAERPKLTAAAVQVDLRDPRRFPASDQLRLVLHPCAASIHGVVADASGGPVAGALVARGTTRAGVQTDEAGAYELCVPAGGANVTVRADGYATTTHETNVFGRMRQDFQLVPAASVVGRVVRQSDGAPVAGALVDLRPTDRGGLRTQTMSADDGTFAFDSVMPGRHVVSGLAEGLASEHPIDVLAEIGVTPAETRVELVASVTVSGKVVAAGTKNGVAGALVYLYTEARRDPSWSLSAYSQTDGSFSIAHVLPGEYRPGVDRSRETPLERFTVETKDITGLVLEAHDIGSIAGRVLFDGKPVDGASVRGANASDTTDAEGRYVLRNVAAGTHELYASSELVGAFTNTPKVTIAAGEQKTNVDIVLDYSSSIAGVVVDQNDAPVAGVFVAFSLLRGRDFGSATTADDGSFTARTMSGGGEYGYEVRQNEESPLVYAPVTGRRHPPIAVKDGQTRITGVRIKVKYERLVISGRVVDDAGKPIADAMVTATPRAQDWYRVPTVASDQNGAFTLKEMTPGAYTLKATTARGEAREENIAAGASNVKLVVLGGGGVDGTLEGFSTPPEITALRLDNYMRSRAAPGTTTATTFQLRDLAAGRYRVTASLGDRSESATVQVMPNNIAKVTLVLGQTGVVVGRVVDSKGAPVEGMRCTATLRDTDRVDYDGPRRSATSTATGEFRIEKAPAGEAMVGCYGREMHAWEPVDVKANDTTRVTLEVQRDQQEPVKRGGYAGLELEDQLGEVLVKSVDANGPAARAGIAVGDSIVTVDGYSIGRYQSEYAMGLIQEPHGDKKTVTIVHERNDKQITTTLTLDPPK